MANVDAPFGLRPIGNTVGGTTFQTTEYQIKDNQSNSIFQGDIVEIDTSNAGFVDVQAAVSNEDAIGVFNGCFIESDPSTGKPKFSNFYSQTNITQGAIKAFVFDNPYQRFLIQGDSATAAAQTDVGKVADTIATHSGSTTTGISGVELDVSDLATSDGQLRVTGFTGDPSNNELSTTHTNYVVYFNEHAYNHNE
tara:strand:+ start:88 stop:672 length:585 start_codon:yes stop_codon:yes gene_type:complete